MYCGFLDLKFLSERAAKIGGSSNPPHQIAIQFDRIESRNRFFVSSMIACEHRFPFRIKSGDGCFRVMAQRPSLKEG
jgi:hypothetical protein